MYDIIIIGGGPAGLTSAIYAGRSGKHVLIIEKSSVGGQMTYSPKIENYPGFISASGNEIADAMTDQVLSLGTDMEFDEVISVQKLDEGHFVVNTLGGKYEAKSLILSPGCKHRRLGLDHEEEFIGNGISFCALCDGAFYKDMDIILVGGGNSALQEAILLADICKKVTIIQNLAYLTGEAKLIEQVNSQSNIDILYNSVAHSLIIEDGKLKGLTVKSADSNNDVYADGIFVAIGLQPENKLFSSLANLDDRGYFDSDENCTTKTAGVFVAGDCRHKNIRQITTAVADGATASLGACRYIDSL